MGLGDWSKKTYPNGLQIVWRCEGNGTSTFTVRKKGSKEPCALNEIFPPGHTYSRAENQFVGGRSEALRFMRAVQEQRFE